MRGVGLWLGAVLLLACSQGEALRAGAGGGSLQISVHTLGEAQVQEVHLLLEPSSGPALPIVLRSDNPNVDRDASGQPVLWSWTERGLPAGSYQISAKAYAVNDPDPSVDPTFSSPAIPVQVLSGQSNPVSIFLRQSVEGDEQLTPYVEAIRFDAEPKPGETVAIRVWGEGGTGFLSLRATGDGDLGVGGPPWDGEGSGDARSAPGALIEWTPASAGLVLLHFTLEDAEGSSATLVLAVNVEVEDGDADFHIAFNHAPWGVVTFDSWVGLSEMQVEVEARYGDLESNIAEVDYKWDLQDCLNAGFSVDPDPAPMTHIEGSLVADLNTTHSFVLSMDTEALPDPLPTCTLGLELSDRGLPSASGSASTSQREVLVILGAAAVCSGGLTACDGACVDLDLNQQHCGACENACGMGQICDGGSCLCTDPELITCDNVCLEDLQSHADHCGACGLSCESGESCQRAICSSIAPVPPSAYSYVNKVSSGIRNPTVGAWHPSGEYALVTADAVYFDADNQKQEGVFRYDPSDASLAAVSILSGEFVYTDLSFSPDGEQVLLVGYWAGSNQSRAYVWDANKESLVFDVSATQYSRLYQRVTWSPEGEPWILARDVEGTKAYLSRYDFAARGSSGNGVVETLEYAVSGKCSDMAWTQDALGDSYLGILCENQYLVLDSNMNLVSTQSSAVGIAMSPRPQGDHAMVIANDSSPIRSFASGLWNLGGVGPSLPGAAKVFFSSRGERALILEESATQANARVWEYRHQLYGSSDFNSVDIPAARFGSDPNEIHLNRVLWRPGCDEGLILAGNTSASTGYILEFQAIDGKACPP